MKNKIKKFISVGCISSMVCIGILAIFRQPIHVGTVLGFGLGYGFAEVFIKPKLDKFIKGE